ncbi:HigA family addiction module antitoxin [Dyella amyloliquefaciens]|uniref:HigA family addiction module antitoxin n=1 Tax=Dyella amyloliquefaciens TaxID=1770545 RepID=UPI00102EC0B9|nr:HigA family addiction module antitoxin [Dyella amyloliquefaciens]
MSKIHIDPLMDFDPSMRLQCPGKVLLTEHLRPRAIPLARLARRTGISLTTLRQITLGQRRINAEHALRLSCVFDPTPVYWLVMQARYDLAMASRAWPAGWVRGHPAVHATRLEPSEAT